MCVGHKPHSWVNGIHNICYGLTSIFWRYQILEGKDCHQHLGLKKNELGTTVFLMLRMCRPIFGSGKADFLDSWFCVAKGITEIKEKGLYAEALIKKRRYWVNRVPSDLIDAHF